MPHGRERASERHMIRHRLRIAQFDRLVRKISGRYLVFAAVVLDCDNVISRAWQKSRLA